MSRSTPRGHTDDSRDILMALTSRTSLEAVHDSGLIEREGPAHIGCSGDCADGADCNCSHAAAWRAPRQPRKPEPRRPNLPMSTRLSLWAQQRMAFIGDYRDLLAVLGMLVGMGLAMGAAAFFAFFN